MSQEASHQTSATLAHNLMTVVDYADTLDSLPLELTRGFSDLRELDAVLSSSLLHLVDSIRQLTAVLTDPARTPAERLSVLREVAEFAQQFKLGGEDKIRVVGGVCEGIMSHQAHLSNLLRNSSFLTARPASPPGGSSTIYLPPTTSGKRTRTGANASLATPARKAQRRAPAEGGGARGGGGGSAAASARSNFQIGRGGEDWDDTTSNGTGGGAKSPAKSKKRGEKKRGEHLASGRTASASPSLPASSSFPIASGSTQHASPRLANARPAGSRANNSNANEPSNDHLNLVDSVTAGGAAVGARVDDLDSPHALANGGEGMVSTPTAATTATTTTARRRAQKTVVANDGQDDDGMSATGGTAAAKSRSRRAQASGTSSRRGAGAAAAAAAAAAAYSEEEEEAEDDDDDDGQGGGQLGDGGAGAGDDADGDAKVYCTCRGPSHGEMIGCDDDECPFEWFHLDCLDLAQPPEEDGQWYCDACTDRRELEESRRKVQKKAGGRR